jgi:hypothetical protein
LSTEGFVVVRFGSIKRSHATSSGQSSWGPGQQTHDCLVPT